MGEEFLHFIPVDTSLGAARGPNSLGWGVQAQLEIQMVGPEASGGDGPERAPSSQGPGDTTDPRYPSPPTRRPGPVGSRNPCSFSVICKCP